MQVPQKWRKRGHAAWGFIKEVMARFGEDRVPLAAGAIAFFTLLSLLPLLLFGVSVVTYLFFTSPEQAQNAIAGLAQNLGQVIADLLQDQVLSVVANRGLLTGISIIVGLWTGSQIFVITESAMNFAWNSQKKRPYWMRRGLAILMVIIVGIFLIITIVTANLIRLLASLEIPLLGYQIDDIPWLVTTIIGLLLPLLLVTAVFGLMYRVLPTKKVTLRTVWPGALFAGTLWLIALHVFSWYASHFANFQILYGSLGGLVLLLLWFYYSAFIMLLGAEISAAYHRRLVEAGDKEERAVEESERAVEARREWEYTQRQMKNAADSATYYGYEGDKGAGG